MGRPPDRVRRKYTGVGRPPARVRGIILEAGDHQQSKRELYWSGETTSRVRGNYTGMGRTPAECIVYSVYCIVYSV